MGTVFFTEVSLVREEGVSKDAARVQEGQQ